MTKWIRVLAGLLLLALVACSDDSTGIARVARVDVGPADQMMMVGDSVELTAVPRSASGAVVAGTIFWRSLTPAIATVRASGGKGIVVGLAAGTARIEAESGGRAATVAVEIAPPAAVGNVEVLPEALVLEIGQELTIAAEVKSTMGEILTGRAVTWSVEPAGHVSVTPQPNGRARIVAHAAGEATIRAEVEGAAGQAWVQVAAATPPPEPVSAVMIVPGDFTLPVNHETSLQAIAKRADGSVIFGRPVTWSVTNPAVAEVNPVPASSFAGFRTKAAGTVKVRATVDGVVGEITVHVPTTAPPPQNVMYLYFRTYERATYVNHAVSYREYLEVRGVNGPIENPVLTWAVEDSTIATVDANGSVRGVRAGQTRVRVSSGDRVAQAFVTVYEVTDGPGPYDLTYDWWDGQWHMAPSVGTEKWTDANNVQHDVSLYVTGGSLLITDDGQYERVLLIQGWAHTGNGAQKVVEREVIDRGVAGIIVGGETGYRLLSTTTPGYEYRVVGWREAGHLLMRASIGTAGEHDYLFRLRP